MMCETLDDLVHSAVATAGEDEVGAVADCFYGLGTCGSGAVGCDDLYLDAMAEKRVRGALEHAHARAAAATGVRVEDEGRASHALRLLRIARACVVRTSWTGGGVVGAAAAAGPPDAREEEERRRWAGPATMAGAAGDRVSGFGSSCVRYSVLMVLVIFIMTRARSFMGFASDAKLGRPVAGSLAWQ